MNARILVLVAVVLGFGALTVAALMETGYIGIFEMHLKSWAGMQVLTDLVIMGLLVCIWMVLDGPRHRMNPWPFVLMTLFLGSFGPLFYLIVRELRMKGAAAR